MPYGASFTPTILNQALQFGLLIDPPGRQTTQTISERVIPGSNNVVIDVIGKPVTKIRGRARFSSYQSLKTFEGAVGSMGSLVYSEEPSGVSAILVSISRTYVNTLIDVHLADIEFWLLPSGTITSGF